MKPKLAKSVLIKKGKYSYRIQKIQAEDGHYFYIARRSDSKYPFGKVFESYRDLYNHYISIRAEIKKHFA